MMKFLTCHMPMLGLLATGNSVMIGSSLQTVAVLLSIKYVSGHGYTMDPPSRAYMCSNFFKKFKSKSKGCENIGHVKYEPQSVVNRKVAGKPETVVPTNICGAGRYSGLSHSPASDWHATTIQPSANGKFRFKWKCTACIRTESFQVYITKKDWNGEKDELTWGHMYKFCDIQYDGKKPEKESEHECDFPKHTGNERDIILILTERSRWVSNEMWFNCSDVIIKGDASTKAPTTKAPLIAATAKAPTTKAPKTKAPTTKAQTVTKKATTKKPRTTTRRPGEVTKDCNHGENTLQTNQDCVCNYHSGSRWAEREVCSGSRATSSVVNCNRWKWTGRCT